MPLKNSYKIYEKVERMYLSHSTSHSMCTWSKNNDEYL